MNPVTEFDEYRKKMNEHLLGANNQIIKRIFNLDTKAFMDGSVDIKTKEMIGLACSMVLRCDDCVKYHLETCHKLGLHKEEVFEVFSIATLIGGTIVIPHLRRAAEFWAALEKEEA